MSADAPALRALVDAADEQALVAFLAPLDEPARAALAPVAAQGFADAWDACQAAGRDPDQTLDRDGQSRRDARRHVAALAWLGTGDLADFPPHREIGEPRWYERHDFKHSFGTVALHQILVDRRPGWLPGFVAQLVADSHFDWGWLLIAAGAVERPEDEGYLRGVARWAGHWGEWGLPLMVARDPELLDRDLPAALELPDGIDLIVARDIAGYGKPIWLPVLTEHFAAGHPVRDRILDLLLDRLSSDKDGRDASRYHQFLTKLGPTPGELAARRRALARVAGQRAPGSVSWAVRELAKLGRAGLVPPDELVTALEPALLATARSTAVTALAAVLRATDRDERLEARAMDLLVAAATHPHGDVQLAAVEAALPRLDRHPHVGSRLAELLPQLGPAAAERLRPALSAAPAVGADQVDPSELFARAAAVPAEAATAVGLPAALDAVRRGTEPPAATVRLADCTTEAVEPVTGLDELIDLLLPLVDGRWTAAALERALDGLATIGPRRPGDFARRIGPLLDRVRTRLDQEVDEWGYDPTADLARLVAVWIAPNRGAGPTASLDRPYGWLTGRIREVALGLGDASAGPLLALPTDQHGWITPETLVARAAATDGTIRRPLDTAVALARLHPHGRAGALAGADPLPGDLGRAVRAALAGQPAPAGLPDVVTGVLDWLHGGPWAGVPYVFGADEPPDDALVVPTVTDPLPHNVHYLFVGGLLVADRGQVPAMHEALARWRAERMRDYAPAWAATLWPGDHGWLWRDGRAAAHALRLLLDPHEPVPVPALVVVLHQLAARAPERRTVAVDIVSRAIGDGRVTSVELASAVRLVFAGDTIVTTGRIVALLQAVSGGSALHRATVRAAVTAVLPEWLDRTLAGQHLAGPVALLDDLCSRDGSGIEVPDARTVLERLTTGKGKTATVARRLLARPATGGWPPEALADAARTRIERAEALAVVLTPTC